MDLFDVSNFKRKLKPGALAGIDYGTKKIGIAITDTNKIISSPFAIFQNDDFLMERIGNLIKQNNISGLVVGVPLNMYGDVDEKSRNAMEFVKNLSTQVSIPILLIDERMSSRMAQAANISLGNFGKASSAASKMKLNNRISQKKEWGAVDTKRKYKSIDENWIKPHIKSEKMVKIRLNSTDFNDDASAAHYILDIAISKIKLVE